MGYCSRSQAAALIRGGRVTLKGRIVRDPESPVRMSLDRTEVDGSPLGKAPALYLVMNKPRGVVTTASDEKRRETVYDLLEPEMAWVGPVGRLDKASDGLLLLTNDSEWAARITEPSIHLDKKYHVQVDCVAGADLLARIIRGGRSKRDPVAGGSNADNSSADNPSADNPGEHLHAKMARLLRHGDKNSWLEITLEEGKNRQIRRLLEALGVQVLRLMRVSIGPLELGDLKKGATRRLTALEKTAIDRALRTVPT
jgi:23S rRNA pseudouridine2605 synthase